MMAPERNTDFLTASQRTVDNEKIVGQKLSKIVHYGTVPIQLIRKFFSSQKLKMLMIKLSPGRSDDW
jgi:hypothetical protein